jgi:hypothetical protein
VKCFGTQPGSQRGRLGKLEVFALRASLHEDFHGLEINHPESLHVARIPLPAFSGIFAIPTR